MTVQSAHLGEDGQLRFEFVNPLAGGCFGGRRTRFRKENLKVGSQEHSTNMHHTSLIIT